MGNLLHDLRFALRTIAKNPGFAAAAILSLALGIGANATIFSIANAVLNRHLPVKDPQTLVSLYWGGQRGEGEFSYPDYVDIRDQNHVFADVAAFCPLTAFSLSAGAEPERVWGQVVTGNFFRTTGVEPIQGRGFLPEEDQAPGRNPVVVLGYSLWRRSFAADPAIAGKQIVLNKQKFTVVGVAPEGFRGTFLGVMPELWIPTMMQGVAIPTGDMLSIRGDHWIDVIARLKPGVTQRQAQQAMLAFARQHPDTYGRNTADISILVQSIGDVHPMMKAGILTFVAALTIVVGLVLLIACANVANLLLARAAARRKEIAIRMALGAARSRLIRQLLTESTLLSLAGGVAGILLAAWAGSGLNSFHLPLPMPIDFRVGIDWYVLGYTLLLALATGVLFGLSPALQATRTDVQPALKDEGVQGAGRRFGMRNILVVAQVALSLVLLTGTGLFLRSLQHAHGVEIGFNPDRLLLFSVDPGVQGYSEEQSKSFFKQLQTRLESTPGVRSATISGSVPLSFSGSATMVGSDSGEKVEFITDIYMVSPGFFRTLGIPLVRGREFRNETPKGSRVAVVNEEFAGRFWPGKDALGQTFHMGDWRYEVIGVAKNAKSRSLGEAPKPIFYQSVEQSYSKASSQFGVTVLIKTSGNPGSLTAQARQVVRELDPTLAVFNMETMDQHLVNALFLPRVAATLFGVFGVVGMLLASVGLYGVINYMVSRRTHEIGIRMAVGADARDIRRMVLRQGMTMACIGMVLGLAAAAGMAQLASSLLFGIRPMDTVTFLSVPAILLAVATLATAIPAWRATRVDPMIALRYN